MTETIDRSKVTTDMMRLVSAPPALVGLTNGVVFGAVQFAIAVMRMAEDDSGPKGGRRAPQMRLDIAEDDKAYKVKAEIPGVTKDEIHVSVDGNMVSIRAEVKKPRPNTTSKKPGTC